MGAGTDRANKADSILGRAVLGNYFVDKKLGEGGMGAVYRLKHTRLPNTWAALKVLAAGESEHMRERFEQEALVASAIGSHRVVKPIDLGRFDDGVAYIVMEYVPGRSLAEDLAEYGPLDVSTALRVACRVADTLAIAHEAGIVHRDVKPSNIMLVRQGNDDTAVKLLDFGVARAPGELKLATTGRAVLIGTPGYMAPESITGAEIDGRVDVFALGVVLFEMLAGKPPFCGPSVDQVLASALVEPAPPIAPRRPDDLDPVDPSIEELVTRALAKKPSERFTMIEFQRALSAALVKRERRLPSTLRPSGQPPEAHAELAVDVEGVLERMQAQATPARDVGSGTLADGAPIVAAAPSNPRRNWIAVAATLAAAAAIALAISWRGHSVATPASATASTAPAPTLPSPSTPIDSRPPLTWASSFELTGAASPSTPIDSRPPPAPPAATTLSVQAASPAQTQAAPVKTSPVADSRARGRRHRATHSAAHSNEPPSGGSSDEDELK